MATNPLYQSNDSPNNSTQPTKAVNRQGVNVKHTHNTFDNSYYNYMTAPFGVYFPFFSMEGVPQDVIPLHSEHTVRSLPMSSPFLSNLKLNKDTFLVPMQAILPNTWELIFKNPSQGDDVPDDANCLFPAWEIDTDANIISSLWSVLVDQDIPNADKMWILLILEFFCSQGSLLSQLGYHVNPIIFRSSEDEFVRYSFDSWFDHVVRNTEYFEIDYKGVLYTNSEATQGVTISFSQALSMLRNYGSSCKIIDITLPNLSEYVITSLPSFSSREDFGTDINLQRVLAYQLSCSQFYVNPQVDFLYNAQMYRDNIFTLYREYMLASTGDDPSVKFFDYNGLKVQYDYLSKAYFYHVCNQIVLGNTDRALPQLFDYMSAIFGHRESLRFGDYFTDSRTRPLALGSDSIPVSSDNTVSVINVSQRVVYQRFRNAVIKIGNNFGDYLRGIFGSNPSPDYHFPKFISHQDFQISGFETANTSDSNQGKLVTNLKTSDDNYLFEVSVDMPCVLIGIAYFSVPRVYMQTKDRQFFHRDRYDMFNPMLQYVGDQIVYNHERTDTRPNDEIFGYQSRNNEYKQRYGIVSGGFATKLPAWTFVADSLFNPVDSVIVQDTQSPEFIRAHSYEFDRFFNSISGYSLANMFHFILVFNNKCMSVRPMEINPNIL